MSPIRLKKLWKGDVSALVERLAQAARAVTLLRAGQEQVGQALERADRALYEAKRGGRDRVVAVEG